MMDIKNRTTSTPIGSSVSAYVGNDFNQSSTESKQYLDNRIQPYNPTENIINKQPKTKRIENYICLCRKCNSKLNCEDSACKVFTNSLCGTPSYICTIEIVIFLATLGVFAWQVANVVLYETYNRSYFAPCGSNINCDSSVGLRCSFANASCSCPARNTAGRCDCNQGNYWNGSQCTLNLGYLTSGCLMDYNCDTSKGLYCRNQTCTCVSPKVWLNSTQMCDYNYTGCFTDLQNSTFAFSSANNNTRMSFFVETCIDFCYRQLFKYAHIYAQIALNFCSCFNTYANVPSNSCIAICPGTSEKGYPCGSFIMNNFTIKSIYTVN